MDGIFNLEELNLSDESFDKIINQGLEPEEEEKEDVDLDLDKEDVDKDKEADKENLDKTSSSDEESSTFSVFANVLKEEGVLDLTDDELSGINSVKDLAEVVRKSMQESRYSDLTEGQQRYLKALEVGLPLKDYEKAEQEINSLVTLRDRDLSKPESIQERFDLIAYSFIDKGFTEEKAVELANRSIKLGTDLEDSKEALEDLISSKHKSYKDLIENKKEEGKLSLDKVKEAINSKDSILKGVKINDAQKEKLYNLLTLQVEVDENGRSLNEVNKWRIDNGLEAEIILGAIYQMTNKFQDLGKIMEASRTKASKDLEHRLRESRDIAKDDPIKLGKDTFQINI